MCRRSRFGFPCLCLLSGAMAGLVILTTAWRACGQRSERAVPPGKEPAAAPIQKQGDARAREAKQHVDWVAACLREMEAVRVGKTRGELLKVFTTEGGLSTGIARTYVHRECPYFKVDVKFKPVGRPERDAEGRVTLEESPDDTIVGISRPYLNWSVMD